MGGRNFMMGNYQFTPLYRSWAAIELEGEKSWFHELSSTYPPADWKTQGLRDKLALRHGLKYVWEHPGQTLKRDVVKFLDFWGLERELIAGAVQGHFGAISNTAVLALAVLICGSYAAVTILGIFGAILFPPRDKRYHALLLLVIAFVCGMHTIVFGHSRYHLPLIPLVLIYTANAVANAPQLWAQRHHWSFRLAGCLSALLIVGWLWGFVAADLQPYLKLLLGSSGT
jgi:hypothetical protein